MSRKREKQRDNKRELARQLDVDTDAVPEELLAHGRVTEPEVTPSLLLRSVKRGLLTRAAPLLVDIALYVVDGAGARLGRALSFRAAATKTGSVELTGASARGDEKIRYTRPGSFVVLAAIVESAEPVVEGAALALVADGPGVAAQAVRAKSEKPAPVPLATTALAAAGLVVVPAVHRVQTSVDVPLLSERVDAVLTVKLRL